MRRADDYGGIQESCRHWRAPWVAVPFAGVRGDSALGSRIGHMRRAPGTGNGELRARGDYIDTALMRRARVLPESARARAAGALMRRVCWHVGAGPCAERSRTAGKGRRRRVKRRRVGGVPCRRGIGGAAARLAPPHRLQGIRFAIADFGFCSAAVARSGFFASGRGYSRVRRAQGSAMYIEKAWIARAEVLREPGLGFARFAQPSGRTRARRNRRRFSPAPEARIGARPAPGRRQRPGGAMSGRQRARVTARHMRRFCPAPGARRRGARVAPGRHAGRQRHGGARADFLSRAPRRRLLMRRSDGGASKTCSASSAMVVPARFSRNEDSRGMAE